MMNFLSELNPEQLQAVTTTEGYVRVIAGAGSGKTKALAYRFAYLVNALGVMPKNILCSTFTNKAANEMKERIRKLTDGMDTGYVCTFHSLCVSILQEDGHIVHYPKNFRIIDNSDARDILGIIYEERRFTSRNMTYKNALEMISYMKLKVHPDYYMDMISMSLDDLEKKYRSSESFQDVVFYGFIYHEKKVFGLDYNDLFTFALHIFDISEETRLKWQKRMEYVMVDEFQDIGWEQEILMGILSSHNKNLFVVGDPDQIIYTWRGAKPDYILKFPEQHVGTNTIILNRNYRSTPQILAASNSLICKNKQRIDKMLVPNRQDGQSVLCYFAVDTKDEAGWICEKIQELHESGIRYRDIAILYRSHFVSRPIEDALMEHQIPYKLYSGTPFYERKEIKDTISYLSMLAYQDDLSFLRVCNVPKRNIGKKRIQFLQDYASKHECSLYQALKNTLDFEMIANTDAEKFISLIDDLSADAQVKQASEILSEVLDKSGYEKLLRTEGDQDRLDNLAELKQSVLEYETGNGEESTLADYLPHITLLTNSDLDNTQDKVKLMTIHSAKGLEFPYVFFCGLNEGIIPSKKTDTIEKLEEERRLAFVAMTRAEDGLFLSTAEGFNYEGTPRYPSRFLLEIDQDLLEYVNQPSEGLVTRAKGYIMMSVNAMMSNDAPYFSAGQRVRHSVFGYGTILEVNTDDHCYVIQFDKLETTRNLSTKTIMEPVD